MECYFIAQKSPVMPIICESAKIFVNGRRFQRTRVAASAQRDERERRADIACIHRNNCCVVFTVR